MLGQKLAKMKYHFGAIFIMLLLIIGSVFLLYNQIIFAQTTDGAGPNDALVADLNKQISEQQAKIDALADKMDQYRGNISNLRKEAVSLQGQIQIINNQIAKTNLDIEAKEEEIKITELEIEKVEIEIKDSEDAIDGHKDRLAAFIRQLNVYDQKNYLAILLGNNSFGEFFNQIKYLEGITDDVKKTLNRVQELVTKLDRQKTELNDQRQKMSDLLSKLEQEKSILESQQATKSYLVIETKNSERQYQNLLSDLQKDRLAADTAVDNLESKLREELEKKGKTERFNTFGDAQLVWPTSVRRVTGYYHDPSYPFKHLFEHSGLDLATPMGTPIVAAEAGYVARVSLGTKWYGHYIMIIHNNNLSTLYAHLNNVNVKVDQYVAKGEVIGGSGSTGFSTGPHLHFEVRYNGVPVNPLNYLP